MARGAVFHRERYATADIVMSAIRIIFLGAPGSGKGTQASLLSTRFGVPHLSTGAMLRESISSGTELGKRAESIVASGGLVDDSTMNSVVGESLTVELSKSGNFILDGFPRTLDQAVYLSDFLSSNDVSLSHVIELSVDDSIVVSRISGRFSCGDCGAGYHDEYSPTKESGVCDYCGSTNMVRRDDDKPDLVRNRLSQYHTATSPLIDYYADLGLLHRIDGMLSVDEIASGIDSLISGSD